MELAKEIMLVGSLLFLALGGLLHTFEINKIKKKLEK